MLWAVSCQRVDCIFFVVHYFLVFASLSLRVLLESPCDFAGPKPKIKTQEMLNAARASLNTTHSSTH